VKVGRLGVLQLDWVDLTAMAVGLYLFGGLTLGIAIGRFLAKARHRREFWDELG
jgi:hypothetical protein